MFYAEVTSEWPYNSCQDLEFFLQIFLCKECLGIIFIAAAESILDYGFKGNHTKKLIYWLCQKSLLDVF